MSASSDRSCLWCVDTSMRKDRLPIASPCTEDWDAMDGDERRRSCQKCDKEVVNLSELTDREVQRLFQRKRGQDLCVRYAFDDAGNLELRPSPVPPLIPAALLLRGREVLLGTSLAAAALAGCNPAGPAGDALLAEGVAVIETPSSKCGETWVRAKIEGGHAWYGSDILANMPSLPPNFVVRQLFKWTKSAPGYRLFNLAHKIVLKDRKATLRAMLEDVKRHPPRVMVPAHGGILSSASLGAETERLLMDAVG